MKISSIIVFIISFALVFGFVGPGYATVQSLLKEKSAYDDTLTKSKELRDIRTKLTDIYNTFPVDNIDRLNKMIPDNIDNVQLVMDLNSIASKHGMIIRNVVVNTGPETDEVKKKLIGNSSEKYGSVTLDFSVTTPYESFKAFLADLRDSLRLVDVVSIDFSAEEINLYKFDLSIKTYWIK